MLEIVFFNFYYSTLRIYTPGEGNGNPLQYYCLQNPHGQKSLGGVAVHGVEQSQTQLKQLAQHSKYLYIFP